ncbi:hypothetical protein GW17_00061231 [Ensete ventricosum]|nr:hypothetical protein GW17_00061231 [Ensete ventricosum]
MGIMYMRTIIRISQIYRDWIVLFSKGCPNPIFPFYAVVAAPAQAAVALACRQPPLRLVSCPQAMPLWAPPLYGLAASGLPAGAAPAAGRPLAGCCPCGWPPLARGLAAAGRPLAGGPRLQPAGPCS